MPEFAGKLGIVQRVLPRYRAAFFDGLAAQCRDGMSLFAGQARRAEAISPATELQVAQYQQARNMHLLSGSLYLCWQLGLRQWLETWDPAVLVVEANPRYLSTPSALRWMRARERPVVGWGLGAPQVSGPLQGLRQSRRRAFLGQFDALIAYSQRGGEEYRQAGMDPERVFVVPNAVASRPAGQAPERPALKGPATVLFVGRLQARKRLDALLHACAALPNELQPTLHIVGNGPARAQLQATAHAKYPQAQFHGALYDRDLEEMFRAADLFVLPGTGGLAVQQAMAHALPVIVGRGDGTQNDLVTEENGWLIPPDSEQALLSALEEALRDPEGLRAKGRVSFQTVQETFNLENMIDEFVKALNRVKV